MCKGKNCPSTHPLLVQKLKPTCPPLAKGVSQLFCFTQMTSIPYIHSHQNTGPSFCTIPCNNGEASTMPRRLRLLTIFKPFTRLLAISTLLLTCLAPLEPSELCAPPRTIAHRGESSSALSTPASSQERHSIPRAMLQLNGRVPTGWASQALVFLLLHFHALSWEKLKTLGSLPN